MDGIEEFLQARRPRTATVEALALAFAVGIALALAAGALAALPWLALASVALGAAIALRRRPAASTATLLVAVAALGGAWSIVRLHAFPEDHLATRRIDERVLVRVRGVALDAPRIVAPPTDAPGRFLGYGTSVRFRVRVHGLADRGGRTSSASGTVLVHVDEPLVPVAPGTPITAIGFLRGPRAPRNPGTFDGRFGDRLRGEAADLFVRSASHVTTEPAPTRGPIAITRLRIALRDRARAALGPGLPPPRHPDRDALLDAVLFGRRHGNADDMHDAFRRVGIAHLLAVSGMHLGVLVALAALGLRTIGRPRLAGLAVISLVLLYLAIVEVRVPVLRAGALAIAAAAGGVLGRRFRTTGLLAAPALALLVRHPGDLATPGFQLSFGVVLALLTLVPPVQARWCPAHPTGGAATGRLVRAVRTAVAAAVVAWLTATPLVVHHFGLLSPLAVPAGLLGAPLVALLLALGFLKIALAAAGATVARLLGAAVSGTAETLLALVSVIDRLPAAVVLVTPPSAAWCAAALAATVAWALAPTRRVRRTALGAGVVLAIALLAGTPDGAGTAALQVDMLDVGDGSCHLVRSGGRALLYDAGSLSDPEVADRVIVPALRALGVRALDAVLVSHPNVDHYGAVPAIAAALPVGRVLVTTATRDAARTDPDGPEAWLFAALAALDVPVALRAAGAWEPLGSATVTWLAPTAVEQFDEDNDASMVVSVAAAGRRVLFTGDIGPEGITRLVARHPNLRADVVELPHHGSVNPEAAALLARLAPAVVLQSTGPGKRRSASWSTLDASGARLVTSRDGACGVVIDAAGRISTHRFLAPRSPRRFGPP